MTIESAEQLAHTQSVISELELAIASARRRLGGNPASQESLVAQYGGQLEELRSEVNQFLGIQGAPSAALQLRFETRAAGEGVTSLHALSWAVDSLRVALTSIAESLVEGTARELGRPQVRIARAVDLRVVGFSPGSFNLELEYPTFPEPEDTELRDLAERSVSILEDGLRWVEGDGLQRPASLESEALQKVVLSEVRNLAPTPGGPITWIELRRVAAGIHPPVRATSETYRRANQIAERSLAIQPVRLVGYLREIDLDKQSFELVPSDGERRTKCQVAPEILGEALSHLNSQQLVVVTGTRRARKLVVSTIEPFRE